MKLIFSIELGEAIDLGLEDYTTMVTCQLDHEIEQKSEELSEILIETCPGKNRKEVGLTQAIIHYLEINDTVEVIKEIFK